jgi:hypothetical protein
VIEAAFAAALGLRLGGTSRYGDRVEERPTLGDGKPPSTGDIAAARTLARHVQLALVALLAAAEVASRLRRSRLAPRPYLSIVGPRDVSSTGIGESPAIPVDRWSEGPDIDRNHVGTLAEQGGATA